MFVPIGRTLGSTDPQNKESIRDAVTSAGQLQRGKSMASWVKVLSDVQALDNFDSYQSSVKPADSGGFIGPGSRRPKSASSIKTQSMKYVYIFFSMIYITYFIDSIFSNVEYNIHKS